MCTSVLLSPVDFLRHVKIIEELLLLYGVDSVAVDPTDLEVRAWSMEHCAWGMEHGAWSMEHGAWGMGHGAWSMDSVATIPA